MFQRPHIGPSPMEHQPSYVPFGLEFGRGAPRTEAPSGQAQSFASQETRDLLNTLIQLATCQGEDQVVPPHALDPPADPCIGDRAG